PADTGAIEHLIHSLRRQPDVSDSQPREKETPQQRTNQFEPVRPGQNETKPPLTALSSAPSEITNSISMKFILIPAGEFFMGSENGYDNEKPMRRVQISKPFYLGKYPVTQEQWQAVMRNNPSHFTGDPNRPVENVSWADSQEFFRKLS